MDNNENNLIANADFWLRDMGVITDYHKNVIMLMALSIFDTGDSVKFSIDEKNKVIHGTIYYKWWKYITLFRKKKKLDLLNDFFIEYLPQFKVLINFEIKHG